MNRSNNLRSSVLLSLTALIWGVAFVFQSMGNNYMQPFFFNASRNTLGCLILIPLIILKWFRPDALGGQGIPLKKLPKKLTVVGGILCGIALTTATMFQQISLKYTTVGKVGFITTLYIILTPIFGLFIRKKCPFTVWIGAAAAVVGMYMLCITESFSLSLGDLLALLGAVFFSVHILFIDHFSPKTDGVVLSCIQFFVSALICWFIAFIVERPSLDQLAQGIIPVLYTGIMSSGVAYTLQIIGQRNFNPTIAALIMSMESVISALASYFAYQMGFLTQDQSLTALQITGCVIMFCAVIFVQLPFDKLKPHKD